MKITYKGVTKDLKYYKGLSWNKPLTPKMKEFNKETGKNAIRGNKITGTFEYWMYWDPKKTKNIKEDILLKGIKQEHSPEIENFKIEWATLHKKIERQTATVKQKQRYKVLTKKIEKLGQNKIKTKSSAKGDIARLKALYDKTDKFHSPEENRKIMDKIRKMEKEIAQRNKKKRLQGELSEDKAKPTGKLITNTQLQKYTKRELDKIEEWKIQMIYYDRRIKEKERTIASDIKKKTDNYDELIKKEKKKIDSPKWRLKELEEKRWNVNKEEYKTLESYRKEKKKYQNKILEYELEYNKVNKILGKLKLRKSKWSKGRVASHRSAGYYIYKPTVDDPKIVLGWNSYEFAKEDKRKKEFNEFKDKIIPELKNHGINYITQKNIIIITKKD